MADKVMPKEGTPEFDALVAQVTTTPPPGFNATDGTCDVCRGGHRLTECVTCHGQAPKP